MTSPRPPAAGANRGLDVARTAAWGLFCASSWTWCIGMYLPIIMLHLWGWPGVLVFAVPNIVGCAAFGYVVRTRGRSRALVAAHRRPMRWFSVVAIAYHVYFIAWAVTVVGFGTYRWTPLVVVGLLFTAALLVSTAPERHWPALGAGAWLLSLLAFARLGLEPIAALPASGALHPIQLAGALPVFVFGFLLCPYLDLTFHRALQSAPSRHAFGVFGVAFAVMLGLTCAYAAAFGRFVPAVVVLHVAIQATFTMGVHIGELRRSSTPADSPASRLLPVLPLAAAPLAWLATSPPEIVDGIYVRFLAFYGLVFPAWVLFFMDFRGFRVVKPVRADRRRLAWYAVTVIALLPLYELGFLGLSGLLGGPGVMGPHTWLLAVATAAVLIVAAIARTTGR